MRHTSWRFSKESSLAPVLVEDHVSSDHALAWSMQEGRLQAGHCSELQHGLLPECASAGQTFNASAAILCSCSIDLGGMSLLMASVTLCTPLLENGLVGDSTLEGHEAAAI